MQKFKVGQMVEDFEKGVGVVTQIYIGVEPPVSVEFESGLSDEYTIEGQRWQKLKPVLRLTGRQFNVGDRVVIGENKGVVRGVKYDNQITGVMINMEEDGELLDTTWVTSDGRAWPGTPIICEHDWEEEEAETVAEKVEKGINALGEAAASCGLESMPVEDVTESPEEVRHIADIQEQSIIESAFRNLQKATETDLMPRYVKMALALECIEVDLKTADLIREIVDSVNAHGGQYNLDTSCNIRQKIEEKYGPNI